MQLITDLKKLSAAITANGKAHAKVDSQWQLLAVSAIAAFEAHGNVFYVNQLYKAMGKGARHKAMVLFLTTFGGVKAQDDDQTPFVKDHDKKVNMADAMNTMWYDMAPSPKPVEVLDYLSMILKIAKKSPKEGQTTAHSDFREKVLALAQEYAEAEQAAAEAKTATGETTPADSDPLAGQVG